MDTLPLLLALLLSATPPPSARTLNTQGFRLYQAGQYPEALEKFEAAAQADPKLALAHYNVAATLGVLRKKGKICDYSAYRETIVERLTRSVELDPRRLTRAKADADLDPIRDTLGWQRLLGLSPQNEAHLPKLLRRVTWFKLDAGMAREKLTFPDARRVVLERTGFDEKAQRVTTRKRTGTYTLQGRTLRVAFPNEPAVEGTLSDKGALQLGALGTFTDLPPECDA
ncbi:tetratricopeptide repeat protein [Cystobacter fuscus]|uniref:tetratricopeptide repeat protein n=1 Tax=Cystobacter fuscus TaxID=43 RepID=UPI002B28BB13|nr:tetratricopeptide repeat protein [Cystobacter fuscus]